MARRAKTTKRHGATILTAVLMTAASGAALAGADLAFSTGEAIRHNGVTWTSRQVIGRTAPSSYAEEIAGLTSALPERCNLDALDYVSGTRIYFSLAEDVRLGGAYYADEDVILWDGSGFSMAWDGSAAGLPERCDLDALDVLSESPLVFSFSLGESVRLPGPGVVDDEDLVRWTGTSFAPQLDFDGSEHGVPARADLEGFNRHSPTQWLLTFDTAGTFGTVRARSRDIAAFSPAGAPETGAFTGLFFDGEAAGLPPGASLDALEATPGQVPVTVSSFSID